MLSTNANDLPYVVTSMVHQEHHFEVAVLDHDGSIICHSKIKVVYTGDNTDINCNARKFAPIGLTNKLSPQRAGDGSIGPMFALGLQNSTTGFGPYANRPEGEEEVLYSNFLESFEAMAKSTFPLEWSTMIQSDYCCGITHHLDGHLGKSRGVVCPAAMYFTLNYASAQHVDFCDGSVLVLYYSNNNPQCTCVNGDNGSNFVFGNLQVLADGQVHNGLTVKLEPGVAISFEGRSLRHGTSLKLCECCSYGFLMAANANTQMGTTQNNIS